MPADEPLTADAGLQASLGRPRLSPVTLGTSVLFVLGCGVFWSVTPTAQNAASALPVLRDAQAAEAEALTFPRGVTSEACQDTGQGRLRLGRDRDKNVALCHEVTSSECASVRT
jgi:hypothetical protein